MYILTFDVEEWFHLLDNDSTRSEAEWVRYPVRIYENMERIFRILEDTDTRATFFVIGWIARTYPDLVRFGQFVGGYHRKTGAVFPRTGLFDPQQRSLGFRGYPGVRDRGRLFGVSGASRARRHPFLRQGHAECYQP